MTLPVASCYHNCYPIAIFVYLYVSTLFAGFGTWFIGNFKLCTCYYILSNVLLVSHAVFFYTNCIVPLCTVVTSS